MASVTVNMGGVYETFAAMENRVLEVKDLNVYYRDRSKVFARKAALTQAIHQASFHLAEGEILGLCGESGCGKTTLSKAICGIIATFEGSIRLSEGRPLMVFQDPYSSLNPSKTVGWLLEEPLRVDRTRSWSPSERADRVAEVAEQVELDQALLDRFPTELSGGQRQRVSIAAAIMREPRFIIADEPVSALDVTIQRQVLDLLRSLNERMGLSILFISHDLRVVYQLCERVMIMRAGRILEQGPVANVYRTPQHPYTAELLTAAGLRPR